MSKSRPSSLTPRRTRASVAQADLWLKRVFHNSYTRKGRRRRVRNWSVKLQFKGRRRTFSLAGESRREAASEARRIYETLRADGWEGLTRATHGEGPSSGNVLYWKGRLRLRQSGAGAGVQYSARIDHAGQSAYFPLGSGDPEEAATRAMRICERVEEQGWDSVRASLSFELTIGFYWFANPLLWSYTTLHTLGLTQKAEPAKGLMAPAPETLARRPLGRVALLEPNAVIRDAMVDCLSRKVGVDCAAYGSAAEFRESEVDSTACLCLVNVEAQEPLLPMNPPQMSVLPNGGHLLPYSVHVDSDELFLAAPGGLSGYCFKRLPPGDILKPVLGLLSAAPSTTTLVRAVQDFFQGVVQVLSAAPEAAPRRAAFTPREHEVLALLSRGYVDKEIARDLGISVWTVHEHVKRVFEKLGVHSRLEAMLAYMQK